MGRCEQGVGERGAVLPVPAELLHAQPAPGRVFRILRAAACLLGGPPHADAGRSCAGRSQHVVRSCLRVRGGSITNQPEPAECTVPQRRQPRCRPGQPMPGARQPWCPVECEPGRTQMRKEAAVQGLFGERSEFAARRGLPLIRRLPAAEPVWSPPPPHAPGPGKR